MMKHEGSLEVHGVAASLGRESFADGHPHLRRVALVVVWYCGAILLSFTVGALLTVDDVLGSDAHAYWAAAQSDTPYGKAPGDADAFLYSPAFLLAISPLTMFAWPPFFAIWVCVESAVLVWLVKPLPKKWGIPIFMCCLPELTVGNINLLIAGAAVLAVRTPALWVFQVFTKVTPGIGILWFAFRGDWPRFMQSTAAIFAVIWLMLVLDPTSFLAWIEFLVGNEGGTEDGQLGFVARCLGSIVLLAFGARTSRAWLIAPALLLASPVLFNFPALSLLAAIPRLSRISTDKTSSNVRNGGVLVGQVGNLLARRST